MGNFFARSEPLAKSRRVEHEKINLRVVANDERL